VVPHRPARTGRLPKTESLTQMNTTETKGTSANLPGERYLKRQHDQRPAHWKSVNEKQKREMGGARYRHIEDSRSNVEKAEQGKTCLKKGQRTRQRPPRKTAHQWKLMNITAVRRVAQGRERAKAVTIIGWRGNALGKQTPWCEKKISRHTNFCTEKDWAQAENGGANQHQQVCTTFVSNAQKPRMKGIKIKQGSANSAALTRP